MMVDREKVINGLECHRIDNNHRIKCADCPYYVDDDNHIRCVNDLHDDTLKLLKEQEEEIQSLRRENHDILTQFHEWAKEQPQIVRCKDCKHRSEEMYNYYGNPNNKVYVCQINDIAKRPDWFCADGERR